MKQAKQWEKPTLGVLALNQTEKARTGGAEHYMGPLTPSRLGGVQKYMGPLTPGKMGEQKYMGPTQPPYID